ncbi:MAG: reverse transcriptase domain-containing protein, partial [Sedimenticola sp.]
MEIEFETNGIAEINIGMLKLFILLYADDIVFFADSENGMQNALNFLSEYCQKWKLKVNTTKTKIVVFRKGGMLPRNLHFYYNGSEIEIVTKFTYLGIVFTPGGSFKETQSLLAGQALKAIFKLNSYLYKFTDITPLHRLQLFDKLISPILSYGSEIWGFVAGQQIEKVHLQFCKSLLGVKKSTQNDFIYGELGRTPLIIARHIHIIKYWFKIIETPANKYRKQIYNMMLTDIIDLPTKSNWASLVRTLLSNYGFYHVWLNQGVGNVHTFLSIFKQRLTDIFVQQWQSRINDSSRALFYKNVCEFKLQYYLKDITVMKFRTAFARLKVSSHRLAIESGRWN